MSAVDVNQRILSRFATVDEVIENFNSITVVDMPPLPELGNVKISALWKVSDPTGKCIIIEIVEKGTVKIHEAFAGIITNSPTYDWHMINLRNYTNLTPNAAPTITIDDVTPKPSRCWFRHERDSRRLYTAIKICAHCGFCFYSAPYRDAHQWRERSLPYSK